MRFPFHNADDGYLNTCQISGKDNLVDLIDLGNQPLSDTLIEKKNLNKEEKYFPLKILRSPTLGHSQLNYIVPHEELYHPEYPYRPGITKEIIEHHSEQAKKNKNKYKLNENELVVDIGSNDGTLLKCYKALNFNVLGIEPTNMADVASKDGVETIKAPFDLKTAKEVSKKYGKAKLMTATNVFAHMSTLGSVMEGIMELLSDDGFFIIENHNMRDIIKHNQYDTFYHEHIRNYSFISLKYLFEMYNLKVVDADVVERYNGSIRVVVTKNKDVEEFCNIQSIVQDELDFGILEKSVWDKFSNNIVKSKKGLVNLLNDLKKQGKSIVGNSCPARCSTLINYCDIGTDLIPYIAEQPTSFKLNKFLPGKKIPIIENSILFDEQPDYVLILAWHLSKPITEQLKQKGLKSKFIIPLPEVEII
jgi:2-polyprenyl-3-methyl-5-hydroxy-6-metoxy-1,4-benzoquinol methylase